MAYLLEVIENTIVTITKDILGPVMIGILAFMLKLIQIMVKEKTKID